MLLAPARRLAPVLRRDADLSGERRRFGPGSWRHVPEAPCVASRLRPLVLRLGPRTQLPDGNRWSGEHPDGASPAIRRRWMAVTSRRVCALQGVAQHDEPDRRWSHGRGNCSHELLFRVDTDSPEGEGSNSRQHRRQSSFSHCRGSSGACSATPAPLAAPGGEAQVDGATTGLTLRTRNCTEVSFSSPGPLSKTSRRRCSTHLDQPQCQTQAHGVAVPGVSSRYVVTGTAFRGRSHRLQAPRQAWFDSWPPTPWFPKDSEPSPHPPKRKRIAPRTHDQSRVAHVMVARM